MNWFNAILIVLAAFLAVFLAVAFEGVRGCLAAQLNLLPVLMVYAGLCGNRISVALLAVVGGLGFDAFSANPAGVSILPLFTVGLLIQLKRDLILRDQRIAQFTLGLGASAAVPALTLLLLLSAGQRPLLGWGSLWHWGVMSVGGAILTPVCFYGFRRVNQALNYRPLPETSFRPDREIRRGRF